jgi:hypothetical protein
LFAGEHATVALNGLSPRRSNPRRGFEIMKIAAMARICSGSVQNAPLRWSIVNPDEAVSAAPSSCAPSSWMSDRRRDPATRLVLGSIDAGGLHAGKTALGAFSPGQDELNFQKTHQKMHNSCG